MPVTAASLARAQPGPAVDRWLRVEELEHDVLALLAELEVLTPAVRERVAAVGKVNVGGYEAAAESVFSDEQVARLYALNPGWAAVERRVYGDTRAERLG